MRAHALIDLGKRDRNIRGCVCKLAGSPGSAPQETATAVRFFIRAGWYHNDGVVGVRDRSR